MFIYGLYYIPLLGLYRGYIGKLLFRVQLVASTINNGNPFQFCYLFPCFLPEFAEALVHHRLVLVTSYLQGASLHVDITRFAAGSPFQMHGN